MADPFDDYAFACLDLSHKTQGWYRQKLTLWRVWCEEQGLDPLKSSHLDVQRYVAYRRAQIDPRSGKPLSAQTIKGDVQVIKGFLTWALREEVYAVNEKTPGKLKLPKAENQVIETFTRDQIKRLLLACAHEYNRELQVRDQAILRTLLSTGIRASELCSLTLDHTVLTPNDPHLRVMGKGRKERQVPLGNDARQALYRYLTHWRRGRDPYVFHNRANGRLTPDGLDQMLYRLRDWSGITGVRCSAHTFRHTFALEYLRQGGDIYRLSHLLGHASVAVTEVYLRAFKVHEARQGVRVFDDL